MASRSSSLIRYFDVSLWWSLRSPEYTSSFSSCKIWWGESLPQIGERSWIWGETLSWMDRKDKCDEKSGDEILIDNTQTLPWVRVRARFSSREKSRDPTPRESERRRAGVTARSASRRTIGQTKAASWSRRSPSFYAQRQRRWKPNFRRLSAWDGWAVDVYVDASLVVAVAVLQSAILTFWEAFLAHPLYPEDENIVCSLWRGSFSP